MGIDDRTTHLHDGRFLPGVNCCAARLWLSTRDRTPLNGLRLLEIMIWLRGGKKCVLLGIKEKLALYPYTVRIRGREKLGRC
jgi:hypothetical protein